jgi:2-amino-4-hydroxy-6-hydroxymethyldihydropteridine diphosphokinase
MTNIYLHLGSNNEGSKLLIDKALGYISEKIGNIKDQSNYYETEPWGLKEQPNFINLAVTVESSLSPSQLLKAIKDIESEMGRIKTEKWGPRVIDIDIIFYGDMIIKDQDLEIPHPHIQNRNFVLIPLMEIAGNVVHPVLKKEVEELYMESKDECEVWVYENE